MVQQSTIIEYIDPMALREHPLNQAIYGDEAPEDDLISSIKELGIIQPLHATRGNMVISGHRRLKVAKIAGLPNVPVIRVSYADELEERRKLLEFNRYRAKNGSQLYAEGVEYEAIESELAKRRQATSGPGAYGAKPLEGRFPQAVHPDNPRDSGQQPASKYESMSDAQLAEAQERLEAQRVPSKTGAQLYAEGLEHENVEAELAKRRQETGWDKLDAQEAERVRRIKALQSQEKARESQTRDKVASSLGIGSGKQWDKLKAIGKQAEAGNIEAAKLLPHINKGMTIATAVKKLKDIEKQDSQTARIESTKAIEGVFDVIVMDPPWQYNSRAADASHRARNPYVSMSVKDLESFQVPAKDDAILWLWATNAFMHEAFHLLEEWGFEYKTCLTWAKSRIGLGDWLRGQTEHCLLAVRGQYRIHPGGASTLLEAANTEHSAKPDEFYTLVESLCPGTKIDIFARRPRAGWAVWGAESDAAE